MRAFRFGVAIGAALVCGAISTDAYAGKKARSVSVSAAILQAAPLCGAKLLVHKSGLSIIAELDRGRVTSRSEQLKIFHKAGAGDLVEVKRRGKVKQRVSALNAIACYGAAKHLRSMRT
jgi:hypothetical protein